MGSYIGEADLYWTKIAFQNKLHSSSGKILIECTGFLKLLFEFPLIQARGVQTGCVFCLQVEGPAPTRRACKWGSLYQGGEQPTARLLNVMKIVAVKNATLEFPIF